MTGAFYKILEGWRWATTPLKIGKNLSDRMPSKEASIGTFGATTAGATRGAKLPFGPRGRALALRAAAKFFLAIF